MKKWLHFIKFHEKVEKIKCPYSLLHPHPRWCVYHSPLDRGQINRWSVQHTKIYFVILFPKFSNCRVDSLTALPMASKIYLQAEVHYIHMWSESTSESRIYLFAYPTFASQRLDVIRGYLYSADHFEYP